MENTRGIRCDYCERPAQLVTGAAIYTTRPDLHHKNFYLCTRCDAYVGCHGETERPLGRLANCELRLAKRTAHAAFDPLWLNGTLSRYGAYRWLSDRLGISRKECHIGKFDVEMCERVVSVCKRRARGED